ncbi:MAG: hypothetical protein LBQ60_18360 [Bacteroidales bacterium]|jgi:hypothetical protein|nr:hypothetical protein [Bacteroidales bacterium]
MSRRWNKLWIGLVSGIALPLLLFFIFYLIMYAHIPFGEYLVYSAKMRALPKILSLCAIPNLIIFYLFLNKEYWYATRGIIAATLLLTLGVVAVKLFV